MYCRAIGDRINGRNVETLVYQANGKIFMNFAAVNTLPFDDSDLIYLDNKVFLHSFLKGPAARTFWPTSYVMPRCFDTFQRETTLLPKDGEGLPEETQWILKDPAGYGSHGCRVVTTNDVVSMYQNNGSPEQQPHDDVVLCQKMVEPPMLFDGRKFSLRIYVVYFPADVATAAESIGDTLGAKVFLSTAGLFKFAFASYI